MLTLYKRHYKNTFLNVSHKLYILRKIRYIFKKSVHYHGTTLCNSLAVNARLCKNIESLKLFCVFNICYNTLICSAMLYNVDCKFAL